MQIELRPSAAADEQLVYEITEAAMRGYVEQAFGPWVPTFQRELIGKSFDPATHQFVQIDGATAGLIATTHHDSHVQLEKLYLLPRFQRQGVGAQLIGQVVKAAKASQKPVRLRVLVVNTAARRLYERLGFVVTGVERERVLMEHTA